MMKYLPKSYGPAVFFCTRKADLEQEPHTSESFRSTKKSEHMI